METLTDKPATPLQQNELLVINALPDAILGINRDGKINFLNRSAEGLLGFSLSEIAGLPLKNLLGKGSRQAYDNAISSLLNSSNTTTTANARIELIFKKKNEDKFRADVLACVSSFAGAAILLSIRDITLPQANNNLLLLQSQNEALKNELSVCKAEINAANEELEAFKFSLAHDLRSPLRIISGYTKIVEKKYENLLNDEAHELLDSIQNYSHRLSDLMAEMLSFSKLGKTELVLTTLDMASIAQSAINDLNNSVKHNAQIKLGPLKPSTGDPFMMIKVFYHLLSNAVKYSSKTTNPVVQISSYQEDGKTVYSISDNGIGFDMKYEQMIYSLFYRLHDLTEYEGMGVGLAVVQRIIKRHGGKLWATSKPGKGSTFFFSLPSP